MATALIFLFQISDRQFNLIQQRLDLIFMR